MKLVLLTVETSKESWNQEALELYLKKISRFYEFEIQKLKSKSQARDQSELKKKSDSELILSKINKDDFVLLCDEHGRVFSSEEFSRKVQAILESGKRRFVIVVGGAYGASEELKKRANLTLSLSTLVMNHLVAQVVVLEQLYRAFNILKNIPYHND